MTRWKNAVFNISFALNCLLVFLLFFGSKLLVPTWLQVGGRMHPLLLHFPIVIIVLYALWLLLARANSHYKQVAEDLLLLAAFTAVITALCGILLAAEPGYDPEALEAHRWAGCCVSFALLSWFWISATKNPGRWVNVSVSFIMLLLVSISGDLGAEITHGDNFLMAPVTPQKQAKLVLFEDAFVYADLVQPILDAKCVSCHNAKKAKGQLIMETADLLLKGGKDGKLWDTTEADMGLMMRRVHLPEDEKEHMPPSGKPQLTDEEIVVLEKWIRAGADMKKKVTDLSPADTLRVLAYKRLKGSSEEKYDFEAADDETISKLNNTNRVIYPLALKSPALVVNFYNSPYFNSQQLEELNSIKQQVVELNLAKMPVKDGDLKTIAQFNNLRTLNLNYSSVTGNTLGELKKLPHLKSLSLTGTAVTANGLAILKNFPTLRSVFIWNTGIDDKALAQINNKGKIRFETGFNGDKIIMKLTPPILQNSDSVITTAVPVQLKHYIPGTMIRFTTDGTDPDSTGSTIYKNDLLVHKNFELKTRAVKPGWYSSDVVSHRFYTTRYRPDSVLLLKPADPKYRGKEGQTLGDLVKSEASRGTGKWLGFRDNDFEGLLIFHQTVTTSSVTVSMLKDIGGQVFPPVALEVWGGMDKNRMRKLAHVSPRQPVKGEANGNIDVDCKFAPTGIQYMKIVARPLAKMPSWHEAKGQKAWIFLDEVMVN